MPKHPYKVWPREWTVTNSLTIFETAEQRMDRFDRAELKSGIDVDRLCAIELCYFSHFRGINTPHTITAKAYDMAHRYIWKM